MTVIGITGRIGSGKSMVVDYLEKYWQAETVKLDTLGRLVIEPGTSGYDRTLALFGTDILREDGSFDRAKIAEIIFRNENMRLALDDIVHPEVRRVTFEKMHAAVASGKNLFVIESALIFEAHYDAICDEVWYIYADDCTRYRRLLESRGYSRERISGTDARQLTDREFRTRSSLIINNGGSFEETGCAIDAALNRIFEGKIS